MLCSCYTCPYFSALRACAGQLVPQTQKPQQQFVAFPTELFQRTAADLLQYAIDNGFLQTGCEVRIAEILPAGGNGARQVLHEMMNSALTTAQVKQQIGSHDSPTQPRTPVHRGVRIRYVYDFLLDQMGNFPVQGGL